MADRSARPALKRKLWAGSLVLLLVTWVALYLPNLRTNPGWYGDETLAITCGLDLVHGIQGNRCLWNTFWNPGAPYQPGYLLLVGSASQFFGGDILGGRFANTLLALGIALLICFYGRPILGTLPALFAALLFLTYEQTVIHFRWNFAHNLIALGFTISTLALARKARRRNDLTAGVGLGVAASAYPLFVYGLVPALLLRIKRPKAWPWLFGPTTLMVGISLILGLIVRWPEQFLTGDLLATAQFYTNASGKNGSSVAQIATNFWYFFTIDPWHELGFACLLLCLNRRLLAIGLSGLVISFLLLQNRQNLMFFYYQAVILLPLTAMAFGGTLQRAYLFLRRKGIRGPFLRKAQLGLIGVPVVCGLILLPSSLTGSLLSRIAYWTVQSVPETENAAKWLNEHTTPEDLVICHTNMAWLLKARTADLLLATRWAGAPAWPYEKPMPATQYRYEPDLKRAAYVVVSEVDLRWTLSDPNVAVLMQPVKKWPVVWSGENITILANPETTGLTQEAAEQ